MTINIIADGVTDNADTLDAITAGNIPYTFPSGVIYTSRPFTPPRNARTMGQGVGATIIRGSGQTPVVRRVEASHLPTAFNITMGAMTIDANGYSGNAVEFGYFNEFLLDDIEIINASGGSTGRGLFIQECYLGKAHKLRAYGHSLACVWLAKGNKNNTGPNNFHLESADIIGNNMPSCIGLYAEDTQGILIDGRCDFEGSGNGNKAIDIRRCDNVTIKNNYIELWRNGAIFGDGGGNTRIFVEENEINALSDVICDFGTITSETRNQTIVVGGNKFMDLRPRNHPSGPQKCVRIGNAQEFAWSKQNLTSSGDMCELYDQSPKTGGIFVNTESISVQTLTGGDATIRTVSVPGARPLDPVQVSFNQCPLGITMYGQVSSSGNSVNIAIENTASGTIPAFSGQIRVVVTKIH